MRQLIDRSSNQQACDSAMVATKYTAAAHNWVRYQLGELIWVRHKLNRQTSISVSENDVGSTGHPLSRSRDQTGGQTMFVCNCKVPQLRRLLNQTQTSPKRPISIAAFQATFTWRAACCSTHPRLLDTRSLSVWPHESGQQR